MPQLATSALHDAAAEARFPGPGVHQVLRWLHEYLRPATYVEIGVDCGASLRLAQPPTLAIGIDPAPRADGPWPGVTLVFSCTSGEFFRDHDLRRILRGMPLALGFIDGLHLFEQALEDFRNLERFSTKGAILALHDTIPLDRETASREKSNEFHTGDVWKILVYLRRFRPELEAVTVLTAPTGLTLVRGLSTPSQRVPDPASVNEVSSLDFSYFEEHAAEFLGAIPNHRDAVEAFCQNTPVQSILSSGVEIPWLRR